MKDFIDNNEVLIKGTVVSDFVFSHSIYGEGFYTINVHVDRLSDAFDIIPIMVSDRLMDISQDYKGCILSVKGQIRTYNRKEQNRTRLILSVFAREIEFLDNPEKSSLSNQVYIDGYICKVPSYRKTPLGREIVDVVIAVNRPYGKSDYIPCICWGRNANYVAGLNVGDHCQFKGRIQSRSYKKRLSDNGDYEERVAYEVSVSKVNVVEF